MKFEKKISLIWSDTKFHVNWSALKFWLILGHFGSLWVVIGHFGSLWLVIGHFG